MTNLHDTVFLPDTAPFDTTQRAWINGYLAGLLAAAKTQPQTAEAPSRGPLLFLFGSQTGSSEALARKFSKESRAAGFDSRVLCMEDHASIDFSAEKRVILVTSTYGDGDMPDNAQGFWDFLKTEGAPGLGHMEFSVLALGDTNYVQFCEAGKKFDARLEELGARRVHPRADCDTDYEEPAAAWFSGLMKAFGSEAVASEKETGFGKANPYPATLKTNRCLNAEGSAKDTRHFEILLDGSGLSYEVGDALGVMPKNCPDFVLEILSSAGLEKDEDLREKLIHQYDLKPFLTELPQAGTSAEALIAPLKKLQPRLYSISSSPKANPGEVHLTVGIVRYEMNGRPRKGVCSTFLAERSEGTVPVFVHPSPGFKPPKDPAAPMIMVGPGTGIAPFRAFLQERKATGASGPNWLFFGDQRQAHDFLYREELEAWQQEGFLTRLDTAFSRDQSEKIYVQDRMLENAGELWRWLENGAHFYVCGDAARMAKDVDSALHKVCETAGGLSPEEAAAYIQQLKSQKRYCRDVY